VLFLIIVALSLSSVFHHKRSGADEPLITVRPYKQSFCSVSSKTEDRTDNF
jgi:hypothetical protein